MNSFVIISRRWHARL